MPSSKTPHAMAPQFDLTQPDDRRRAEHAVKWQDHGVLRTYWHNFAKVMPGAYRSNHPTHDRLAAYQKLGVVAVLNLRGSKPTATYLLEAESCDALGLQMISVPLAARKPAPKDALLALFAAFDAIPRPFLMHCKSGADRAGLAAALYVLDQGGSVQDARAQLSIRFLHLKFTKTGVQDHMLDLYAQRAAKSPISIRDWITNDYDPDALAISFAKRRTLPI